MTRIEIDLNVRVRGNGTRAGFEDVEGPMAVGMKVQVYESESGLGGTGRVTEIDPAKELVVLSVDWASLREVPAAPGGPEAVGVFDNVMRMRASPRLVSGSVIALRYGPANGLLDLQPDFRDARPASNTELVVAAL